MAEVNITFGVLFEGFKVGRLGGGFNFGGIIEFNLIFVLSNRAIGGGEPGIYFCSILLSFLTEKRAVFSEKEIPGKKGIFGIWKGSCFLCFQLQSFGAGLLSQPP